jgi:hypothetical protein
VAIKKRLTDEERLSTALGKNWRRMLRHEYLAGMIKFAHYPTDTASIKKAFSAVNAWKGASYPDKVFIYVLCNLLWRCNGSSPLSDPNYDRLGKHLAEKWGEVLSAGVIYSDVFMWQLPKISAFKAGTMPAPPPLRPRLAPKASSTPASASPAPSPTIKPRPKRKAT